jgi:hypothetical protein
VNRFLAFAFDDYYPGGGSADFVGDFASMKKAIIAAAETGRDNWEILDTDTGRWSTGDMDNDHDEIG